ncbi:MAG TPA: hypothetical protein VFR34_02680 [Paracoccaceae bacterium]|nr:hypothetical protein [Paracoccaceae bacterium]
MRDMPPSRAIGSRPRPRPAALPARAPGPLLRIALRLSTAPWRNEPPLLERVARFVAGLQDAGWRIRVASPRNYLIWRGHAGMLAARGILVLPNRDAGLDRFELSALAILGLPWPAGARATGPAGAGLQGEFLAHCGLPGGTDLFTARIERKLTLAIAGGIGVARRGPA